LVLKPGPKGVETSHLDMAKSPIFWECCCCMLCVNMWKPCLTCKYADVLVCYMFLLLLFCTLNRLWISTGSKHQLWVSFTFVKNSLEDGLKRVNWICTAFRRSTLLLLLNFKLIIIIRCQIFCFQMTYFLYIFEGKGYLCSVQRNCSCGNIQFRCHRTS